MCKELSTNSRQYVCRQYVCRNYLNGPVENRIEFNNVLCNVVFKHTQPFKPFKHEAQTALFKDPVRTAL